MMKRFDTPNGSVTIVGTAHVLKESVEEVRNTILSEKPEFVAVELDRNRYLALKERNLKPPKFKDLIGFGLKIAFLSYIISYLQERIGKSTGVLPGSEMIEAVECSKEVGAKVFFIDRDVIMTLRKLMREMPISEKLNILKSLLFSGYQELKVPDEEYVESLVEEFRKVTPTGYRVLIEERDRIMAERISRLEGRVVAVVGAGHIKGILKYLEEIFHE